MTEPWFRMHANILDKRVVWRLANATNIHPVRAAGHLAVFWGKVSQNVRGGDVSAIPDAQLEAWAAWDGKRGKFASWLRTEHTTGGIVNEYDEYSGALDDRREKDRLRQATLRDKRRKSRGHNGDNPRDVTRDIGVTSGGYDTIRDDTIQTTTTPHPLAAALLERLDEPDRPDFARFLAASPDATMWAGESGAWLDGARSPAITATQLVAAAREFMGNGEDFAIRLWRGYLRNAASAPPEPIQRRRAPKPNPGAQGYANALAAVEDIAQ